MIDLPALRRIAELEFSLIVRHTFFIGYKCRIVLVKNGIVDVYLSQTVPDRFGFHWERVDGSIFRYDNVPDGNWSYVSTFPYHIHDGTQSNVGESQFPKEIAAGFRAFMSYIVKNL